MRKFNKKNLFVLIVTLLFLFSALFLLNESPGRTLFISLTFFIWVSIFLYTKDLPFSSLLYILLVLPFNITLQLPLDVVIFNTVLSFPLPLVNGIYVNYLVPTLSIIDVGIVFFLFSLLVEKGFSFYWQIFKSLKNGVSFFLLFLIIQNILLSNLLVTFNSIRLFFFVLSIIGAVLYFKKEKTKKFFLSASFVLLLNILIQGGIGIFQVIRGTSLSLSFLGESQVVSGMQGSSFIDLGGRAYLRAYGTFAHPNIFAGFLLLSLLVGILSSKKLPGFGVTLTILSLCLLPFTFSRSAILIAVFILLLLLLKGISKTRKNALSVTPLLFFERFTNLIKGGDNSWKDRVSLLKSSLEVIKENFFLGTGFGQFVKAMEDYVPRTSRGILLLQPVHNIFVLIFAELGIFGFFSFFYVLVRLFLENFKRFTYFKISVLITILVIGFWDHYLFSLPQGLGIFFFLYLLLVLDLKPLEGIKKEKQIWN